MNPDQFSHRPAMVMFVNSPDINSGPRACVTIDMDKINIGGIDVKDVLETLREWKVNVVFVSRKPPGQE